MNEHILNSKFKKEVARRPGGERLLNCYLCGTCTASCPVAEVDKEYNPKGIIQKVLYGMEEEILGSVDLWKCTQCHNCVAHCPQDVRLADVIRVLRMLAVERNYVSKDLVERVQEIDNQSRLQRLEKINQTVRELKG